MIRCWMKRNRYGITFVELAISLGVGLMALLMIYQFMSSTRQHYMFGTVNLQNLQEARLAINYLRRDFSSACPRIDEPNLSPGGYVDLQKIRKQMFVSASVPAGAGGDLLQVLPQGLLFHKFAFGASDHNPRVELVRYEFDSAARVLTRLSENGHIQTFSGIEEVEFRLYTHRLNPQVPILWVRLKVHEGGSVSKAGEIGSALEITTSIASSFIVSSVKNKFWRYEIGHKKM